MELSYLSEFITLAHTCHYQMTAELTFISQSSLSKHINKMEKELGAELFIHSRHNVQLTEFGQVFLPYAEEIVTIERQYRSKLQELLSLEKKEIEIGVMSVEVLAEIVDMLPDFKKKFSESALNVIEGRMKDVLDWLKNEELNVVFMRNRTDFKEEDYHIIKAGNEQPLVALVSKNHRLSKYDSVSFESLRKEIFIGSQRFSLKRQLTEELCRLHGFNLSSNLIIQNSSAVIRLVENNMALMLLFRDEAQEMMTENTKIIEINPTRCADTFIFYSKKKRLTTEEQWLIEYFRKKWHQ